MDAKNHLKKAINLNPDYAEAYYELGLIFKKEGETEQALDHFQKAVSLKSDFAEAECELAIMLQLKNDLESSRNHFLNSLEINPNYAKALYNRSQLFFDKAEYELALRDADACASKEAKVLSLIVLYKLGRIGEIYKRIEGLCKIIPEDISIAAFAAFISKKEKKTTA